MPGADGLTQDWEQSLEVPSDNDLWNKAIDLLPEDIRIAAHFELLSISKGKLSFIKSTHLKKARFLASKARMRGEDIMLPPINPVWEVLEPELPDSDPLSIVPSEDGVTGFDADMFFGLPDFSQDKPWLTHVRKFLSSFNLLNAADRKFGRITVLISSAAIAVSAVDGSVPAYKQDQEARRAEYLDQAQAQRGAELRGRLQAEARVRVAAWKQEQTRLAYERQLSTDTQKIADYITMNPLPMRDFDGMGYYDIPVRDVRRSGERADSLLISKMSDQFPDYGGKFDQIVWDASYQEMEGEIIPPSLVKYDFRPPWFAFGGNVRCGIPHNSESDNAFERKSGDLEDCLVTHEETDRMNQIIASKFSQALMDAGLLNSDFYKKYKLYSPDGSFNAPEIVPLITSLCRTEEIKGSSPLSKHENCLASDFGFGFEIRFGLAVERLHKADLVREGRYVDREILPEMTTLQAQRVEILQQIGQLELDGNSADADIVELRMQIDELGQSINLLRAKVVKYEDRQAFFDRLIALLMETLSPSPDKDGAQETEYRVIAEWDHFHVTPKLEGASERISPALTLTGMTKEECRRTLLVDGASVRQAWRHCENHYVPIYRSKNQKSDGTYELPLIPYADLSNTEKTKYGPGVILPLSEWKKQLDEPS